MAFEFSETYMEGVFVVKPKVYGDERGYFTETYKKRDFQAHGIDLDFNQDNQSFSTKGVLRGLHFQREPYAQGKLIRVIKGKIFDVGVDLREGSKTFGQYISVTLSENGMEILWLPEGFAHGFLALEDSIVLYKATHEYNKESEGGIIWNDPKLAIKWPEKPKEVSEKDRQWPTMKEVYKL